MRYLILVVAIFVAIPTTKKFHTSVERSAKGIRDAFQIAVTIVLIPDLARSVAGRSERIVDQQDLWLKGKAGVSVSSLDFRFLES